MCGVGLQQLNHRMDLLEKQNSGATGSSQDHTRSGDSQRYQRGTLSRSRFNAAGRARCQFRPDRPTAANTFKPRHTRATCFRCNEQRHLSFDCPLKVSPGMKGQYTGTCVRPDPQLVGEAPEVSVIANGILCIYLFSKFL